MDTRRVLSIRANSEFFAVRTKISVKDLERFDTINAGGYRLYWTKTGFIDDTEQITQFNCAELAKTIYSTVKLGDKKGLSVTLYWLPPCGKFDVRFPWGYRKESYKINGEVCLAIPTTDVNINRILMLPTWELVTVDGLNFEYLSIYFVDTLGMQSGLSIWIREQTLPQIINEIDSNWDDMRKKTSSELTKVLKNCKILFLDRDDLCKDISCKEITD